MILTSPHILEAKIAPKEDYFFHLRIATLHPMTVIQKKYFIIITRFLLYNITFPPIHVHKNITRRILDVG